MSNTIKWLWLTTKRGLNSIKISYLIEKYGNINNIYSRTDYDVPHLTKADREALSDKSLDAAERTYSDICSCGARILTCDNKYYPTSLRNIRPMPYVLYIRGKAIDMENMFGIGVVGTRIHTDYGAYYASGISYDLARNGVIIVSGMAKGIDSIAMKAALRAGARTIGVLGCGIDQIYPESNRWLFEEVLENGMIISEYPPGALPLRGHFPQRNRIIAGLSRGILVVEGSKNSGSLITAKFAEEYNRDIFAVPRSIGAKNEKGIPMDGTNHLIQSGAKLVMNAGDILNEYGIPFKKTSKRETAPVEKEEKIKPPVQPPVKKLDIDSLLERASSDLQKEVIRFIGDKSLYADEIVQGLDAETSAIGTTLTMMETFRLIQRQPDGRYKLNDQ